MKTVKKKTANPNRSSNQFARFLEAAEAAEVDKSGRKFAQAMGKITMAKNARKPTRVG